MQTLQPLVLQAVKLPDLSPSQQAAYQSLLHKVQKHYLCGFGVNYGHGRTFMLKRLALETGGHFLRLADFFDEIQTFHPLAIEEGIASTLLKALKAHNLVIVDDFHHVVNMVESCYGKARPGVLNAALDGILRWLEQSGKRLVLSSQHGHYADPLNEFIQKENLVEFTAADHAFLFNVLSHGKLKDVDFERVFVFAPHLNAIQMAYACQFLPPFGVFDTAFLIKFLETYALHSNVDTTEVETMDFADLYGVEEVIRQLEIDIIVPMERDDLAKDLGIRAKRGVLLYGPPGTGKTSIGRALAHRLHSKFFLLDGTVISGTDQFYQKVSQIFEAAKHNAPSILFIDDCDVLFENQDEFGLYRYLLTMLDGLESKSNAQVTVMFTAMNIGSLPPALIRSGRVELWLEMKLPNQAAREAMLQAILSGSVLQLKPGELNHLAELTYDCSGADLKRIVADARNLHGFDVAKAQPVRAPFEYFAQAIEQLRTNRERLAAAPAFTAAHNPAAALNPGMVLAQMGADED
jgi:SpoVK/Ycf46/Vps4 family AAA+-type ATPase